MTRAQRRVYRRIVRGPRGRVVGPLRVSLHRPELADVWQKFGRLLRYESSIPAHLNELAILVTARRWNANLEWHMHEPTARKAGVRPQVIEAIRLCEPPVFADEESAGVYEFTRLLLETGNVPDDLYSALEQTWGPVGMVDLSTLVGYYTLVSMTLNVHEVPVPEDDGPPPLPLLDSCHDTLHSLPSGRRTSGAAFDTWTARDPRS